jgi:hypothetical protein
LSVGSLTFNVECKRPFRENSIHANIRTAKEQLEERLKADGKLYGVIAVCVSRALLGTNIYISPTLLKSVNRNPALFHHLLAQGSEDPVRCMEKWNVQTGNKLLALMNEYRRSVRNGHERIIGMRFHTAAPFITANGSGRFATSVVRPVGPSGPVYTEFEEITKKAYGGLIAVPAIASA